MRVRTVEVGHMLEEATYVALLVIPYMIRDENVVGYTTYTPLYRNLHFSQQMACDTSEMGA